MKLLQNEYSKKTAAAKAGMDEKTARKYGRAGKLPSEIKLVHTWRTRPDPFEEVWPEIRDKLVLNPGLEAKTLFNYLQRQYPARYQTGQLRTLQRRIKRWRALEGPSKEVFFPQEYHPGELCQSDFTYMNKLGIRIAGECFDHLIYHFVLPYSNWETGTICFSESFESLSEGLQNALWELGGVPRHHRTDRMSAAVQHPALRAKEEFTRRYSALLRHYGLKGAMIGSRKAHENGDVEQSHHRFKRALEQALLLRGSRDFNSKEDYLLFLRKLFVELNSGRRKRFEEELKVLQRLPMTRLDSCKRFSVKVGPSSTIRVSHNVYSVESRLIGETIQIHLYADNFEIWYAQRYLDRIPRLRGSGNHYIQYRHIIDWLIRKPGAFENYRYRQDLYPNHRFRMAYDSVKNSKEYLKILHLAAKEGETVVDEALDHLIENNIPITFEKVWALVNSTEKRPSARDPQIQDVDLTLYDQLLLEGAGI